MRDSAAGSINGIFANESINPASHKVVAKLAEVCESSHASHLCDLRMSDHPQRAMFSSMSHLYKMSGPLTPSNDVNTKQAKTYAYRPARLLNSNKLVQQSGTSVYGLKARWLIDKV